MNIAILLMNFNNKNYCNNKNNNDDFDNDDDDDQHGKWMPKVLDKICKTKS